MLAALIRLGKDLLHRWPVLLAFGVAGAVMSFYYWHEDKKLVAILHVALPAMVLFMELYMLRQMTKEERTRDAMVADFRNMHEAERTERREVVEDLRRFRVSVNRDHYLQELERTVKETRADIVFTGVTMSASHKETQQGRLIQLIKEREAEAAKNKRQFRQRGLIAERMEALAGAIELAMKTQTEIKVRKLAVVTRLRFQVCDRQISVIGIADGKPTWNEVRSTHRAFTVDSTWLAEALYESFEREWRDPASKDIWTYLGEWISDLVGNTPLPQSVLTQNRVLELLEADQCGITAEFLAEKCRAFRWLDPKLREREQLATAHTSEPAKPPSEP